MESGRLISEHAIVHVAFALNVTINDEAAHRNVDIKIFFILFAFTVYLIMGIFDDRFVIMDCLPADGIGT